MIRKLITADSEVLTLSLPADFMGKQIEVIAFVVDDIVEEVKKKVTKKRKFTVVKVADRDYKFNRDELYDR